MRRATSSGSPPRTLLVGGRSVADDEAEPNSICFIVCRLCALTNLGLVRVKPYVRLYD